MAPRARPDSAEENIRAIARTNALALFPQLA
jgi:hypothetical protein